MGGPSHEHDISLKSGAHVMRHLNPEKYEVQRVKIDKEGIWERTPEQLKEDKVIALVAMHGKYGEDGTVQSLLESHNIPYTGTRAMGSALAMNKFLSLRLFRDYGLLTPISLLLTEREWHKKSSPIIKHIRHYLGYPIVVKPNENGSSVGVYIVNNSEELIQALEKVFQISHTALIQNYIRGREVTCGVMDHGFHESAFPLLPTEIIPRGHSFFNYEAKYSSEGAHHIIPARCADPLLKHIQHAALRAHQLIHARGCSRTDMIVDKEGNVVILEINTIPGFTEQSLFPQAAEASGISFSSFLDTLIRGAIHK